MYYVKFTIKDFTTKEERVKISDKYETNEMPLKIIENYIAKQKNYIDIKKLNANKFIVEKNGGGIVIEIVEEKETSKEQAIAELKRNIENLKNKKFADLPTEQDIFETEEIWEENKNNMIKKWEEEIKQLERNF